MPMAPLFFSSYIVVYSAELRDLFGTAAGLSLVWTSPAFMGDDCSSQQVQSGANSITAEGEIDNLTEFPNRESKQQRIVSA